MELDLLQESVSINELIYEGVLEQGVESDYVLPDYLADIVRVLKCRILPKITSKQIVGEKVMLDGYHIIKLFYLSEDLKKVKTAEIKLPFSKTQDVKNTPPDAFISAKCRTDYCNCRVINPRRIDIRGAVSIALSVQAQKEGNLLTDAKGASVELLKKQVETSRLVGIVDKQFSQQAELELTGDEKEIETVLQAQCDPVVSDMKIITNKVVLKGEAVLQLLCQGKAEEAGLIRLEKTVPFSQILELEGIDDGCMCDVKIEAIHVEPEISEQYDDDYAAMNVNVTLAVVAKGYRRVPANVITDAYSTKYKSSYTCAPVSLQNVLEMVSETNTAKESLELGNDEISQVLDASGEVDRCVVRYEPGMVVLNGTIVYSLFGEGESGEVVYCEKPVDFEITRNVQSKAETVLFDGELRVRSVSLAGYSGGQAEVKTELTLSGTVIESYRQNAVVEVAVEDQALPQDGNRSALTIYFSDAGESLWDIAKRYHTSKQAIIDENQLDNEKLAARQMLLIPTA